MNSNGGIMKQVLFGIAIMVGLGASNALAADRTWTNTGGGNFTNSANWAGGFPGTNDNALFTSAASYTVTFSSSVTNTFGIFSNNAGTVTIDLGSGNLWRLTGGGDSVAFKGAGGTVNLNGGTLSVADKFGLGSVAGANNNTFQIYGGAVVNLTSSVGDASLGNNGYGNTMIVSNGASLVTGRYLAIGSNAGGSNTTVIVTGNGSAILSPPNRTFAIGLRSDNNLLRIESGGLVANTGFAFVGGGLTAGDIGGGTGNFNRVIVSGGYWTNSSSLTIGQNGAGNRVTVTNGGMVYAGGIIHVGGGHIVDGGAISYSSTLEIADGTVSIVGDGLKIGSKTYASNNTVVVNGTNALLQVYRTTSGGNDVQVGSDGNYNTLIVTNGGRAQVSRSLSIGHTATATGNLVRVTGTGSTLQVSGIPNNGLFVGVDGGLNQLIIENGGAVSNGNATIGGAGTGHSALVTSGGVWTNTGSLAIGNAGSGHSLTVSNNGVVWGGTVNVGNGGTLNTLTVGPGGTMVAYQHVNLGAVTAASSNNTLVVAGAGAVLRVVSTIRDLNVGSSSQGNSAVISNGGQVIVGRHTYAGTASGGNNSIFVGSGGVLEINGGGSAPVLQAGTAAGNSISNIVGVFQFNHPAPSIVNGGSTAKIAIADGTVAFRGIVNADVRVSAAGGAMDSTKLTWSGANTFMLNAATNLTSNQTYTFQSGNPTNFAKLALLNSSLYRGGAVTIGAGGTLVVSNGTSTISSNLTFQPGATFAVHVSTNATSGSVVVGGTTIALGGATLQLTLGAAPVEGQNYPILSLPGTAPVAGLGTFSSTTVDAVYAGKTYTLSVRYGAGDGNDVAVKLATRGTVFMMR
jgi:T5SS/PEP-CTERM-associated repeat protein